MRVSTGSLVGPYRILAPLGAGGMGEVYRARDEKLNRDVALKILAADLAANSEHLRRFQQEAHAASALNHPNIITIYDIGQHEGAAYIAMELVLGQDLRLAQAGTRLPVKTLMRMAVKVADGLAAAHERGIVHRDLKPENIMISRDGFVKILDFGLAKLVQPITETQITIPHTTPGAVFGTVAYMSPEQAAGRPLDFRSDQFSLGVILYEMLAGRMPFSEATAAETLAAIIRDDPPSLTLFTESVPPDLVRVVSRCLSKDPGDRYASTRDLARDLREIRDRASNGSQPRFRSDRPAASAPRRRAAWVGSAIAAVVGGALVLFVALRTSPVQPAQPQGPLSVAMLPFHDLSNSSEGRVFTDGLAEMIRSRLGESRSVRVIPAFDSASRGDPPQVARRLGAAYAVTGSVQRKGEAVSVSVSLIDAHSGAQVAGQALEGSSNDLFSLDRQAAELILSGMRVSAQGARHTTSPDLTNASDQNDYVQALGLLQNARDEKSVDRAIATLERLLLDARDSAPVNAQLARALYYKAQMSRRPGLIEQATVYAERAAEIDESLPEIHVRLGQLRNASGRYADAEREYQKALALRGDNADAYIGLAETKEAMGRAGEAESMYRKAIALRPNHANTYNRYAVFLFNAGRHEEAAANFRRFTELMPTARGFSNLGAADQALGRFEQARQDYEKSIALEPTSNAYLNLGMLHYYRGEYDAARRANEQATALAAGNDAAWLALGDVLRWSPGLRDRAAPAYQSALKAAQESLAVNDRDAVAHAVAANALVKLNRVREGAAELDRALKLDPTNQTVLYTAAVVSLLRGNSDAAVGWLQRAVRAGYPLADLQRDPEFRVVRSDPSFPVSVVAER